MTAADHFHRTSEQHAQLRFLGGEIALTVWEWLPLWERCIQKRQGEDCCYILMASLHTKWGQGNWMGEVNANPKHSLSQKKKKEEEEERKNVNGVKYLFFFKFCLIVPEILHLHCLRRFLYLDVFNFWASVCLHIWIAEIDLLCSGISASILKWFKSFHINLQFC